MGLIKQKGSYCMKKLVIKMLVLSLVLGPVAFLGGCNKRCGERCEPIENQSLQKMKQETRGGK